MLDLGVLICRAAGGLQGMSGRGMAGNVGRWV